VVLKLFFIIYDEFFRQVKIKMDFVRHIIKYSGYFFGFLMALSWGKMPVIRFWNSGAIKGPWLQYYL